MGTELQTFAFNGEELSCLLKFLHSSPFPDSPLAQISSHLESINTPAQERFIREGILEGQSDALTPLWREILDALADPSWEITLIESQKLIPYLTRYYPLHSNNQYVGYSQVEEDLHHLSLFHTPSRLMEEVTRLLPDNEAERHVSTVLPFREFVAFLSIIDIFRTVYLESYIDRCSDFLIEFIPTDLFSVLNKGLNTNDYRWCVPIGRLFSPQSLVLTVEQVDEVLKDMESHQLLKHTEPHDNEPAYRLTANTEKVCKWLLEIDRFLAFKAHSLKSKGPHLSFALICGRTENARFTISESSSTISVDVSTAHKSTIEEYMAKVFQRIAESTWKETAGRQAICVRCSQKISGDERFCTFCGTAIASASPFTADTHKSAEIEEQKKMSCPYCKIENNINAHFCKECGKIISPDTMKPCPRCNKQIKEESRFCRYCGYSFTEKKPFKEKALSFEPKKETRDLEKSSRDPGKTCPSCKKQVRLECHFCRFCGHNFPK